MAYTKIEPYLSKSDFLKYLTHPAYLWLQKHAKNKLPPISANDQFVFDQGNAFEAAVRTEFKDGQLVDALPWEFDLLTQQTQNYLEGGSRCLFQGSVMTERRLFCKADILERRESGWWIIEVKGSTRVKDEHLYDLAFQVLAFEEAGVKISGAEVIYINSQYVRQEKIVTKQLMARRDVTAKVRALLPEVAVLVPQALAVIKLATCPADNFETCRNFKNWLPLYLYLHPELPLNSVYFLAQVSESQLKELLAANVDTLESIPATFTLTSKQFNQVQAQKHDLPTIKTQPIAEFLQTLKYPLYFLDYETVAYALPLFKGTRPYQQVPFQYSLHVLRTPDTEPEHYEYLARSNAHPVIDLLSQLKQDIGSSGSILVWYANFEKSCNTDMGKMVPNQAAFLAAVNARIVDLMDPFYKQWYVDSRFLGSASIKKVLPVLVPSLSYKDLGIQEGGSAQRSWYETMDPSLDNSKRQQVFNDLIEYCKLDTLAMVEIYKVLKNVTAGAKSYSQAALF